MPAKTFSLYRQSEDRYWLFCYQIEPDAYRWELITRSGCVPVRLDESQSLAIMQSEKVWNVPSAFVAHDTLFGKS